MTSVLAQPGAPHHAVPVPYQPDLSTSKPDPIPRGPVSVALNFYQPPADGSVPFNWVEQPPAGGPQRNYSDTEQEVSLHDLRGQESRFGLHGAAFAALAGHPHNPAIDWDSDASIKQHYYPEVEALLQAQLPGAGPKRILLFDHTVRRARPDAHRAPVTRAHIDQTPKSARQRVEFHLPDEAAQILADGTRYRIVNVWRPLNGSVESFPLAFADSATVPDGDMVGVQHRYPDRTGETAAVKHNPAHKWYYWSGVDNDERILLQCFDSENPMNRVPHSAFVDPRSTAQSKPRESIEVRALILG